MQRATPQRASGATFHHFLFLLYCQGLPDGSDRTLPTTGSGPALLLTTPSPTHCMPCVSGGLPAARVSVWSFPPDLRNPENSISGLSDYRLPSGRSPAPPSPHGQGQNLRCPKNKLVPPPWPGAHQGSRGNWPHQFVCILRAAAPFLEGWASSIRSGLCAGRCVSTVRAPALLEQAQPHHPWGQRQKKNEGPLS